MRNLPSDLSYSIRRASMNAGVTTIVVLTMTAGIGATTAIFSLVDSILLSPLPYADSSRIVLVSETSPQGDRVGVSPAMFGKLMDGSTAMESLTAVRSGKAALSGAGAGQLLSIARVTPSFFDVFGVSPNSGRRFQPRESENVAILSHEAWLRNFGGDPKVLGRGIALNDVTHTLIGVMPAGFRFFRKSDVFTPLQINSTETERSLTVAGKLAPAGGLDQARAEVATIARTADGWTGSVESLQKVLVRGPDADLPVLLTGAVFLLLIACANVAGLLLAVASARTHEMAVRVSAGATRSRLIRQLLTENILQAAAAAVCGVFVAQWTVALLRAPLAEVLPVAAPPALNLRVLGFTVLIAAGAGLLFGLAPALQATRIDLVGALSQGSGRGSGPRSRIAMRSVLVAAEIAASVMLVAGAGLTVRALSTARNTEAGLDPARILTFNISLLTPRYADSGIAASFLEEAIARAASVPSVREAAITTALPPRDYVGHTAFEIVGSPVSDASAQFIGVSPGYFRIMGLRVARGRGFTDVDMRAAEPGAVVSESFARKFAGGREAIGARIQMTGVAGSRAFEVVGVVADAAPTRAGIAPPALVFVPYRQQPRAEYSVLLLGEGPDASVLAAPGAAAIQSVDNDVPVSAVQTYAAIRERSLLIPRVLTGLLTGFGLLALLLAMIGTYGLMAYSVMVRTREIGIRTALGATRADVLRLVLKQSGAITLMGAAAGLLITMAMARVLRGLLFGIPAGDLLLAIMTAVLLAAATLAAAYLPARRATRIAPLEALRHD